MTVQTHTKDTLSVYREALAREGMRFADGSGPHKASPTTYLQIADNAVETRRQARAHLALGLTESALLTNSVAPDAAGDAAGAPAVSAVRDARYAVAQGDYARASLLIRKALTETVSGA